MTTSRIRLYERQVVIAAADRGADGYRDYPENLVALLRFIEQAQGLGSTPREVTDVEIRGGDHIVLCTDALSLLEMKRDTVTALIVKANDR